MLVTLKGVKESVGDEKILIVAFIASFASRISNVASYTYGTLLVQDSYPDTKDG